MAILNKYIIVVFQNTLSQPRLIAAAH